MSEANDIIIRVKCEIRALQDFLARLESYTSQPKSVKMALKTKVPGGRAGVLVGHCIGVISAANGRVRVGELLDSILDAGLEVRGVDQKSNLAGYLSRDPRVNYIKPDGWGLS